MITLRELYEWTRKDEENLKGLYTIVENHLDYLIDYSYKSLQKYEDWVNTMNDPKLRSIHTDLLKEVLKKLILVDYNEDYISSIKSLASFYIKIGMNPKYFGSLLSAFRESVFRMALDELSYEKNT